jgi:hypothetical protein
VARVQRAAADLSPSPLRKPPPPERRKCHTGKKFTAKKPCETRENEASPCPLARDVDLNPEENDLCRLEKIRFSHDSEVFQTQVFNYFRAVSLATNPRSTPPAKKTPKKHYNLREKNPLNFPKPKNLKKPREFDYRC